MVAMIGMMWWQSRKAKQQQAERQDFRANLQPGTEIITIGGVIGKVVSVDVQYEEIVIDSEGSLMRFSFNAISKEYVRPAYISDDEVDENGNPIEQDPIEQNDDEAQVPMDQALESAENTVETTETVEAEVVDTEVADEQPQEAAK
ncbi:preprotein translocase subunit YajC [Bifidobacterium eulemuris]|nr:preprotein translocase subunit YajC [Bifidobacterium eulemuris]QOL33097.1 preprotein translocase subunit YajC [Bifidobacterium eulemuris]